MDSLQLRKTNRKQFLQEKNIEYTYLKKIQVGMYDKWILEFNHAFKVKNKINVF